MSRAVLFVAIASAAVLSAQTSARVGVYLQFDGQTSEKSLQTMELEAAKILEPSGVSLQWRNLKQNQGNEAFSSVIVLRFKGDCRPDRAVWSGVDGKDYSLANTLVEQGKVKPFSEVECDQVRRVLPYAKGGRVARESAMGVALGRVVAHELYHFLANSTHHAAKGLFRASQSWTELIGKSGAALR